MLVLFAMALVEAKPIGNQWTLVRTVTDLGASDANWRSSNDFDAMHSAVGLWTLTPPPNRPGYFRMCHQFLNSSDARVDGGDTHTLTMSLVESLYLDTGVAARPIQYLVTNEISVAIFSNKNPIWATTYAYPLTVGIRYGGAAATPATATKALIFARFD